MIRRALLSMIFLPMLAPAAIRSLVGPAAAEDLVPRTLGRSTRRRVRLSRSWPSGTILISTGQRTLDYVVSGQDAWRYSIGVGRDGFRWSGTVKIGRMEEWPFWRPPPEMKARAPDLPELVPPGPFNPLGARGIYLYRDGRDTLYRIHGTNDSSSVGDFVSSGCFRMTNTDVIDLYGRVTVGETVIVR